MAAPTVRDSSSTQEPGLEPSFLVVLGPESTETRQLPATGQLAIGRAEDADVRIVDALASRDHAQLIGGPTSNSRIWTAPTARACATSGCPPTSASRGPRRGHHHRRHRPGGAARTGPHAAADLATRLLRDAPHRGVRSGRERSGLFRAAAAAPGEPATRAARRRDAGGPAPGRLAGRLRPGEYEILLVDTGPTAGDERRDDRGAGPRRLERAAGMAFFPATESRRRPWSAGRAPCSWRTPAPAEPRRRAQNPAMRELYGVAERAAAGKINVLVLGETGVGKEVLAEPSTALAPAASRFSA